MNCYLQKKTQHKHDILNIEKIIFYIMYTWITNLKWFRYIHQLPYLAGTQCYGLVLSGISDTDILQLSDAQELAQKFFTGNVETSISVLTVSFTDIRLHTSSLKWVFIVPYIFRFFEALSFWNILLHWRKYLRFF